MDINFPVIREKILTSIGVDTKKDILINGNTNVPLAIVGRKYNVIPHQQVVDYAETLFNGYNYQLGKTTLIDNGAVLYREYRFPELEFNPAGYVPDALDNHSVKAEKYHPLVIVSNAVNGTKAVSFQFGFYRLICANGMISSKFVQQISIRHTKNADLERLRATLMTNFEYHIEEFKKSYLRLNETDGNQVKEILTKLPMKVLQSMADLTQNQNLIVEKNKKTSQVEITINNLSAFALLMLATQVVTHHINNYKQAMRHHQTISRIFNI